jgi:hypothetical protein
VLRNDLNALIFTRKTWFTGVSNGVVRNGHAQAHSSALAGWPGLHTLQRATAIVMKMRLAKLGNRCKKNNGARLAAGARGPAATILEDSAQHNYARFDASGSRQAACAALWLRPVSFDTHSAS